MPTLEEMAAATAAHTEALKPVIRQFAADGITGLGGIARALNDAKHPAIRGGLWTPAQVSRLLLRFGTILMPNRAQRAEATRAHAEALRPVVAEIIDSGITSLTGVAEELNARNVKAVEGGRWIPAQVSRLLLRLGFMR